MKHLFPAAHAALFALLIALSGCAPSDSGGGSKSTIDATPYLTHYTQQVVETDYQAFAAAADDLVDAIDAINTGTPATITTAREAWKATRVAWERSEAWLFGPVSANVDPGVDSWPITMTILDNNLGEDGAYPLDNNEGKGFHVVEYALWDMGAGADSTEAEVAAFLDEDIIEDLVTIAGNIAELANGVADAWADDGGYGEEFILAGRGGSTGHVSQSAAMQEIIGGMAGIADEVGSGKIAVPFTVDGGTLEHVESQFSFNSIVDFHNNILGIKIAYLGQYSSTPTQQSNSISALVASKNATLDTTIRNLIDAAIAAIDNMDEEIFHTTPDDVDTNAQDAIDALDELRTALEGELASFIQSLDFKY